MSNATLETATPIGLVETVKPTHELTLDDLGISSVNVTGNLINEDGSYGDFFAFGKLPDSAEGNRFILPKIGTDGKQVLNARTIDEYIAYVRKNGFPKRGAQILWESFLLSLDLRRKQALGQDPYNQGLPYEEYSNPGVKPIEDHPYSGMESWIEGMLEEEGLTGYTEWIEIRGMSNVLEELLKDSGNDDPSLIISTDITSFFHEFTHPSQDPVNGEICKGISGLKARSLPVLWSTCAVGL